MPRTGLAKPSEVAEHYQVSEKTIEGWRTRGEGPPFLRPSNGTVRYRWADIEEYDRSRTVATGDPYVVRAG